MPALFVCLSFFCLNVVSTYFQGDPFRDVRTILFAVLGSLCGSYYIGKRVDPWFGLCHALFTLLWAYHGARLFGLIPVIGPLAMLAIAEICASREQLFFRLLRAMAWGQALLGIYQLFGGEVWGHDPAYRYTLQSAFGNEVVAGIFFAMIVPVAFQFWSAKEGLLFSLFVFLSTSTMAILALFGALLYYIWCLRGRDAIYIGLMALTVCILGAALFPEIEFFSFSGRFLPWRRAWAIIWESPIPKGPGSWSGLYPAWGVQYARVWSPLHSDFLELLFEGGWGCLILFLFGCYRTLHRVEAWAGCALAALFVNALASFPLHVAPIAFLAVAFLVMGRRIKTNS